MNKKVLFILIFILVILGYIFKIDKIIVIEFTNLTQNIKSYYKNTVNTFDIKIRQYFNQSEQINKLYSAIKHNNQYELLYKISNKRVEELEKNITSKNNISLKYVEVLSYLNMNDFSKVLLDTNIRINNKIIALSTTDGYSAGIVMQKNNQIVAYLNSNEKCNYAVFIGTTNIPGITSGINDKNELIIKYIPKWHTVNIGDDVYTSGMDDIFPSGLKVGKIIGIKKNSNTQTAYLKPSVDVQEKRYFYIIERNH